MTRFILLLLVTCCQLIGENQLYGQLIKRQVLGSLGTNHISINNGTPAITSVTVGQPPNAGTISNSINYLRQGFQQPLEDNCGISATIAVSTETVPNCGTYYTFEFVGTIDPTITVSWNLGPQAVPSIVQGPVTPQIAFLETGPQTILLSVGNGDCIKSVSKNIEVEEAPFSASASVQHAWCFGERGAINLIPKFGTPPYTYIWSNTAVSEDLSNLLPGSYTVTVTDLKSCVFTNTIEVKGSDEPIVFKPNLIDESCTGQSDGSINLMIENAALPVTYTWDSGDTTATRSNLTKGIYGLTIEDANGCKIDTAFKVATYCEQDEDDFIPNTFSPNGDNTNNLWIIPGIENYPNHTVDIYNRWGNAIWSAKGNFAGWDGSNSDKEPMPVGAYYYVIQLKDPKNTIFKGSVTLIR